jgi:hypothetical protein
VSAGKNVRTRVAAFIVGLIATPLGLIMLYYDFFGKKDQWYSDTSYYSIAAFFIGIACFMIAFEKKKPGGDKDSTIKPS